MGAADTVAHNRSSWTHEYDWRPSVSTAVLILHFLIALDVAVVVTFVAIVVVVSLISCVYVSLSVYSVHVYPAAIQQYSTQFTQYFPSGRLPLTIIYPIDILYTYTCMQYKIYVVMWRRINIDNMHQKTVQPIHSFQLSSTSKQIMCFLLLSRLKKTL